MFTPFNTPNTYNGVDLMSLSRLETLFNRYGQRFLNKTLTADEQARYRQTAPRRQLTFLAGRLALKEATLKVLGCGLSTLGNPDGVGWHDVQVVSNPYEAPQIALSPAALAIAQQRGLQGISCTLSHDGDYAIAWASGICQ